MEVGPREILESTARAPLPRQHGFLLCLIVHNINCLVNVLCPEIVSVCVSAPRIMDFSAQYDCRYYILTVSIFVLSRSAAELVKHFEPSFQNTGTVSL